MGGLCRDGAATRADLPRGLASLGLSLWRGEGWEVPREPSFLLGGFTSDPVLALESLGISCLVLFANEGRLLSDGLRGATGAEWTVGPGTARAGPQASPSVRHLFTVGPSELPPLPGKPRGRPPAGRAALGLRGDLERFLREAQGAEVSGGLEPGSGSVPPSVWASPHSSGE